MSTIVSLRGVKKQFNGFEALRGVNLDVESGEIVVVLGPSGAGKSTMLRTINYLIQPDDGEVFFEGQNLSTVTPGELRRIRAKIGFVFQHFNLFSHLNALDNVAIGRVKVKGESWDDARKEAMKYLEKVGMANKAYNYPSQLSGGQKQRVAIARALAMEPDVLLFDEPTSALDPSLVGEVLKVMKNLALEGRTMIVVTHEMGFAKSVATRIVYMENGIVVEESSPQQFFTFPESNEARNFISSILERI
ncbi:MAG: amino acid ABC transporter ATP-binding protein [Thermotogaceae bacterium]|nr:amino acid ABC transporter ATP-binding protein [Thermotogaceae bacterium]